MNAPDIEGVRTLDSSGLFSVREAARLLGMSHNGVLMRVKRKQMNAGKVGSRYIIRGSEIQKSITLPIYDV